MVTLILIFTFCLGAIANELESDFSKLLAVGQLHEQTLKINGYYPTNVKLKIPYQGCPVYNKKLASSKFWDLLNLLIFYHCHCIYLI